MGKAKRRRQLRTNFNKPQIPDCLQGTSSEFLNKQIDLEIVSFQDSRLVAGSVLTYKLLFSTPSEQNQARRMFIEQQIMYSLIPLIQQCGKGWITQTHDFQKDSTQWRYVPANSLNLKYLQSEAFYKTHGKNVSSVIQYALESWAFESSISTHQLIPVLAMTSNGEGSSWLYCI